MDQSGHQGTATPIDNICCRLVGSRAKSGDQAVLNEDFLIGVKLVVDAVEDVDVGDAQGFRVSGQGEQQADSNQGAQV